MKTEEWKTGGTCAAFVDWTGVPIAAGADGRLSGSFRCLECGNSDEPFFGVVTSAVGGQRRGICWPLPPFERARGILQATLRHYNPPPPSQLLRPSFGSLEPSLDSRRRGLRERAACLPCKLRIRLYAAPMSTRTLQWSDHRRPMRRRRRRRRL